MGKKILYRSDHRLFNVGEPVPPSGDHFNGLTDKRKEAEKLIRNGHPNGAALRSTNVYAFPDRARAEKY